MDEKLSREQYRLETYGGPTGRPIQSSLLPSAPDSSVEPGLPISTDKAIIQFDADAFYAQVEEGRNPRLKGVPLAVTQKYLIVTCNQAARRLGVTKLQGVTEAKQQVPSLVLVNGEDLTPYRQASKRIFSVLARFGIAERLGMDEVFVDVTAEVQARIQRGFLCSTYKGHIHTAEIALKQETKHRPMDLRAARSAFGELASGAVPYESAGIHAPWEAALKIASHIAAEARAAVKAECGFRTSAGISCSKMLAKLVSGMHKPDDQTVMLPCHAAAFVATLPVRAIPGIGWKMDKELTALRVTSANDLRSISLAKLTKIFGERTAKYMYASCRGEDTAPVIQSGAPKSITVEDSFKSCTTFLAALHVLQILAPDLIARLDEDFEEHSRRAGTMTLKWRQKKQGWSRSSTSIHMPVQWQASKEQQVEAIVQASLSILRKNLAQPFSLTLLNIGATKFSAPLNKERGVPKAFKNFFEAPAGAVAGTVSQQAAGVVGEELRQAAVVAISARKDYGAAPKGQPLAKSHERALNEASRAPAAAASPGSSGSLSDEGALPEEDEWGIASAPGPEFAVSRPGSKVGHPSSRSANGSFLGVKAGPAEHMRSKDEKQQRGFPTLKPGSPSSSELQALSQNLTTGEQKQRQGFEQSGASYNDLDDSHSSRVPSNTVGQPPSQEIDKHNVQSSHHSAARPLCGTVEMQQVPHLHAEGAKRSLYAAQQGSKHMQQPAKLSGDMDPCSSHVLPAGRQSAQHDERSCDGVAQLDTPNRSASQFLPVMGFDDSMVAHSEHGPSLCGADASTPPDGRPVAAQNHDRHKGASVEQNSIASSQGSGLSELQKLQALSDLSKQQAPHWLPSGPEDLSADLRLAQKLQQEELRYHQLHSGADAAKRKLKKEATLDAFFKRPAR